MKKKLLTSLLGMLVATTALAQDLALKIEHDVSVLAADGVTRISRFSERLVRQDNQSWLVRIVPHGAHEESEHQKSGKSHKHMDVSSAARWVQRASDGKLRVRLVNEHEKVVIEIAPVDYSNIGFDGKWTSVSSLLDPEQIKRMKPMARSAPAGARWFEGGAGDTKVYVLWDDKAQYPRRIESANASGTNRSTMVVTREAMPAKMPWSALSGYTQKEYSDLLD